MSVRHTRRCRHLTPAAPGAARRIPTHRTGEPDKTLPRRGAIGAALATLGAGRAHSTGWQATRPVRLVVSSAPAASLDNLARVLAPALSARLGQTVLVENQGGANGLLAMQQVARAEPDATHLVLHSGTVLLKATVPESARPPRRGATCRVALRRALVFAAGGRLRATARECARLTIWSASVRPSRSAASGVGWPRVTGFG